MDRDYSRDTRGAPVGGASATFANALIVLYLSLRGAENVIIREFPDAMHECRRVVLGVSPKCRSRDEKAEKKKKQGV